MAQNVNVMINARKILALTSLQVVVKFESGAMLGGVLLSFVLLEIVGCLI